MYCKNCGQQIDDNAYVCIHCGVRTDMPLKPKKEGETKFCTHCGAQIDPNAYICVHCGVKTGINVENRKGGGTAVFCAVFSIVVSFLSLTFLGALLGIVGMSIAIEGSDIKGIKLNFAAILVCLFASLFAVIIGIL